MDKDKVKQLIDQVEEQSQDNEKLLEEMTKTYTEQLDNLVSVIQKKLADNSGDLPIDTLIQCISELCPVVFFTLAGLEKIGVRSDLSDQLKVERYNLARQSTSGTAADKTSFAENNTLEETFVSSIYSRAYKSVKMRTDAAQMLIDSLKKALSAKMAELQVMRSQDKVMSN